jgi:hypothetical protein
VSTVTNEETGRYLKRIAQESLKEAEARAYEYATSLDVGGERIKAFEIYENIRKAAAVY